MVGSLLTCHLYVLWGVCGDLLWCPVHEVKELPQGGSVSTGIGSGTYGGPARSPWGGLGVRGTASYPFLTRGRFFRPLPRPATVNSFGAEYSEEACKTSNEEFSKGQQRHTRLVAG